MFSFPIFDSPFWVIILFRGESLDKAVSKYLYPGPHELENLNMCCSLTHKFITCNKSKICLSIGFRKCCNFDVVSGSFHIIDSLGVLVVFPISPISNNSTTVQQGTKRAVTQPDRLANIIWKRKQRQTVHCKHHQRLQTSLEHASCDLQHEIIFLCLKQKQK